VGSCAPKSFGQGETLPDSGLPRQVQAASDGAGGQATIIRLNQGSRDELRAPVQGRANHYRVDCLGVTIGVAGAEVFVYFLLGERQSRYWISRHGRTPLQCGCGVIISTNMKLSIAELIECVRSGGDDALAGRSQAHLNEAIRALRDLLKPRPPTSSFVSVRRAGVGPSRAP
jgi:hypothetical protein